MTVPPPPHDERRRLEVLRAYHVLDTPPEDAFEDITRVAAQITGTPTALVTLVDAERQWFKSRHGFDARETSRDQSFCAHTIMQDDVMIVRNALDDDRFRGNPLVTGDPRIRFYAGAPLFTQYGEALGALCVMDYQARDITPAQQQSLRALARQTMKELELRRTLRDLSAVITGRRRAATPDVLQAIVDRAPAIVLLKDVEGRVVLVNREFERVFAVSADDVVGRRAVELPADTFPPKLCAPDRMVVNSRQPASYDLTLVARGTQRAFTCVKFPLVDWADDVYAIGTIATEVTERVERDRLARRAEALKQAVLDAAPDAVITLSSTGLVVDWNPRAEQLFGWPRREAIGADLAEMLLAEPRREAFRETLRRHVDPRLGVSHRQELEVRLRDGGELPVEIAITRVPFADDVLLTAFIRDITERLRYEEQLRFLAEHDPLTGLPNRRYFEEAVEAELRTAGRFGDTHVLLVLDLDNFKHINDSLGHHAGDEFLISVASLLRNRLRETDVVARIGGDEFAILLPRAGIGEARHVAEQIVTALREHGTPLGGRRIASTASVGGCVFGAAGAVTAEEVMVTADTAMYDAKEQGRDRAVVVGAPRPRGTVSMRTTWAQRIRAALAEERFVLYAQPVRDVATAEVTCHELLLRMLDDDGGILEPGAFLPTAERFDLVQAIDRWVALRAIALLSRYPDAAFAPRFHVNLSPRSLREAGLVELVEDALRTTSVDPSRLVFEITESAAIANIADASSFADRLRRVGCLFALDDFGTGFGSFYYLKHLPLDIVKIDGDFVRDLPRSRIDQLVVQSVVQVAHELGYKTVAEYVEDAQIADLVASYGVDRVQGFHIGRPRPVSEVLADR